MNSADSTPSILQDPPDFSLVLGGPLYQLWRKAHLDGDAMRVVIRRILVGVALTWLPLLGLSLASGTAWGDSVALTFFHDIEMHVRLLIALPILILAELVVHQRMRPIVGYFLTSGLITDATRAQFTEAVNSAMKLRNSVTAEVLLLVVVYSVGVFLVMPAQVGFDTSAWYGSAQGSAAHLSSAGWWMGLVSLPIFQFMVLRWYFRLFIWARFLWRVSRLELNLMPMHPDRAGGLGFLGGVSQGFGPVLVAQGALLAGLMANRMFYAGATLMDFKFEVAGLVTVMVFAVLGPLLVFAPSLAAARRAGMREYGALAHRYALEFDRKWLRGGAAEGEQLIGSADIQSLADLGNSYGIVKDMKPLPFNLRNVTQLGLATLLPAAPLLLTIMPLEELLRGLVKILL